MLSVPDFNFTLDTNNKEFTPKMQQLI